jgi:uncharacterized membrane protein YkvA (DUF1232 family)
MAKSSIKTKWSFKHQILTLFYACKDARTPWYAKITALLSVIYLVSPVDFVPDVIPLAGYIDDLFVVPFLVNISTKLLPPDIKRDAELRARKKSKYILWVLAVIIIAIMVLIYLLVRHNFFS